MFISAIRRFSQAFFTVRKVGKYVLGAAGLYVAYKCYPLHQVVHSNAAFYKSSFASVKQDAQYVNANQKNSSQWTFMDKNGDPIICEWCDISALEKVRSVYVAGFVGHDFLEIADLKEVAKLIDAVWTRRITGYIPKLSRQPPEAFFATAKKGTEIVGFVIFEVRKPNEEVYVTPLVIHPSMQKTGLGKELLFSILKRIPNLKRMSLVTMRTNTNAMGFYKHNGFQEFDDPEDHGYEPGKLISFEYCFKKEQA